MLERLLPPIRGLILDMDGVLWKDTTSIGDLSIIFRKIRERETKVVLATNNATATIDEYLQKLMDFGVELDPLQIVTSSDAITHVLLKTFPEKGAVYVVGEKGLISALCESGFNPISDPADESPVVAVVGGMDRTLTYQKISRASAHIRARCPILRDQS